MLVTCEIPSSHANALPKLNFPSSVETMIRPAALLTALVLSCALGACNEVKGTASTKTLQQYETFCSSCHEVGAANAPRRGDAQQWSKRLRKGEEQLVKSINRGLVAMPPKGGCAECSESDFRALIHYMSQP